MLAEVRKVNTCAWPPGIRAVFEEGGGERAFPLAAGVREGFVEEDGGFK